MCHLDSLSQLENIKIKNWISSQTGQEAWKQQKCQSVLEITACPSAAPTSAVEAIIIIAKKISYF